MNICLYLHKTTCPYVKLRQLFGLKPVPGSSYRLKSQNNTSNVSVGQLTNSKPWKL